jgi:hypothetical protein
MFKNRFYILTLFLMLFISSCGEETAPDWIPFVYVNVDINLSNLQYQDLRRDGGYVYIPDGYKGIIVYRESATRYRAFERACSFDPRSECEPVVVDDSGLFMTHKCCKSTYDFKGYPTGGPASLPLHEYDTFLDGDYLLIRNE